MEKTAQQTKARQEDATPPIPGETAERITQVKEGPGFCSPTFHKGLGDRGFNGGLKPRE